jgi:hypothetical protein
VAAAAGDLGQRGVLEVGQPGAVFGSREEQVPEAALAGRGPELVQHRRGRPRERVVHRRELVVEDLLGRLDLCRHEVEQLLLQLLRAGVEREVHV